MASFDPIAYIRARSKQLGVDPNAALAVARQEGLGGGIGDGGTSFGPWQLHRGGALPSGIPLSQAQSWAWSPAGLNYALSRIASVAAGQKGAQAVNSIVTRFERPANPSREVAGALSAYGLPASAGHIQASGAAISGLQSGSQALAGAILGGNLPADTAANPLSSLVSYIMQNNQALAQRQAPGFVPFGRSSG